MINKILPIIVLFFFIGTKTFGQRGNYFIKNFTPTDMNSSGQTFGVCNDDKGRVFVANLNGLSMFDGKFWTKITIPKETAVISITKTNKGEIYLGCDGMIGKLDKDETGRFTFIDLSLHIKNKINFGEVWYTYFLNNKIYFCSNNALFEYDGKEVRTYLPLKTSFHRFFVSNGKLWLRENEVGLSVFDNGKIIPVKGGELFNSSDTRIEFIQELNKTQSLIATRNIGFWLCNYNNNYNSITFKKLNCEAESWAVRNQLNCGLKSGNEYVLGSLNGGVIICDSTLKIKSEINSNNGLYDNLVKNVYKDKQGNIWLSLNKGLSLIDFSSPISFWKKENGVIGTLEKSTFYDGTLLIAGDKGTYKLDSKTNIFETTTIRSSTNDFLIADNTLLIATTEGIYSYNGKEFKILQEGIFTKLASYKGNIYAGAENGIYKFTFTNGRLLNKEHFEDNSINDIIIYKDLIWLSVENTGIKILKPDLKLYNLLDASAGLLELSENSFFMYENELLLASFGGIYKLDVEQNKVSRPEKYNKFFSTTDQIYRAKTINGNIWYQMTRSSTKKEKLDVLAKKEESVNILFKDGDTFTEKQNPLKALQNIVVYGFNQFENKVYLSTNEGLYSVETRNINEGKKISCFISYINMDNDSLPLIANVDANLQFNRNIPFSKNNLTFYLGANDFSHEKELQFSHIMEGYDKEWSGYESNPKIEFKNLKEGKYIFRVKSRNISGIESAELSFTFKVSPPWYRTYIAYFIYLLLLVALVVALVRYNTKRLIQKNIELEGIIKDRTKEIEHQKEIIEEKNKEVIDSITYARRIQRAMLTTEFYVKKYLQEHFILFRPKDIVSGDFYWIYADKDNEGIVYVVTADCTGHGVPGGFMSMMGISLLKEIVDGHKIKNTADIINTLRRDIVRNLNSEGATEEAKDGMDLVICKYDFKNLRLEYTAANNALYLLRNGELIEHKGDKMPVGKYGDDMKDFSSHHVDLQKGDIIYTTTDGFPDQFGGPKGKKLMYKKFEAALIGNSHLPMTEQLPLLEKVFVDWVNYKDEEGNITEHEQIDDVTVIGVKI